MANVAIAGFVGVAGAVAAGAFIDIVAGPPREIGGRWLSADAWAWLGLVFVVLCGLATALQFVPLPAFRASAANLARATVLLGWVALFATAVLGGLWSGPPFVWLLGAFGGVSLGASAVWSGGLRHLQAMPPTFRSWSPLAAYYGSLVVLFVGAVLLASRLASVGLWVSILAEIATTGLSVGLWRGPPPPPVVRVGVGLVAAAKYGFVFATVSHPPMSPTAGVWLVLVGAVSAYVAVFWGRYVHAHPPPSYARVPVSASWL
jgi:hypothetical protein